MRDPRAAPARDEAAWLAVQRFKRVQVPLSESPRVRMVERTLTRAVFITGPDSALRYVVVEKPLIFSRWRLRDGDQCEAVLITHSTRAVHITAAEATKARDRATVLAMDGECNDGRSLESRGARAAAVTRQGDVMVSVMVDRNPPPESQRNSHECLLSPPATFDVPLEQTAGARRIVDIGRWPHRVIELTSPPDGAGDPLP
ncbi:MAG TPA: hypothetical protein VMY34_07190 [Acidimicrobiales bacterium]|nr:hypothetical protein [Acidimicrobiales bacterium]